MIYENNGGVSVKIEKEVLKRLSDEFCDGDAKILVCKITFLDIVNIKFIVSIKRLRKLFRIFILDLEVYKPVSSGSSIRLDNVCSQYKCGYIYVDIEATIVRIEQFVAMHKECIKLKVYMNPNENNSIIIYQDDNGVAKINVRFTDENVWLIQQ